MVRPPPTTPLEFRISIFWEGTRRRGALVPSPDRRRSSSSTSAHRWCSASTLNTKRVPADVGLLRAETWTSAAVTTRATRRLIASHWSCRRAAANCLLTLSVGMEITVGHVKSWPHTNADSAGTRGAVTGIRPQSPTSGLDDASAGLPGL